MGGFHACFAIGKSSDPHDCIEFEDTLCRIGWSGENISALIELTILMVWIWVVVTKLVCFLGYLDSTKLAGLKVAGNHATHAAEGTSQGRARDAKCH